MLKLVPDNTKIDFLGVRHICYGLTVFLLLATAGLLATKGLNFGIDFSGGTLMQVKFEEPIPVGDLRTRLSDAGLDGATIQQYGSEDEVLMRLPTDASGEEKQISNQVVADALAPIADNIEFRRTEYVGPQVGDELKRKGIIAIILSVIGILAYIAVRFEWRFGVGAIAALLHDVIITVGFFSLLQREISLPVLAALLTVIGYSVNDTVVVFDRIRENMYRHRRMKLIDIMNLSINEMLHRSLMMSFTVIVVLLSLLYFGGEAIFDFSLALLIGVIAGTYSSVYVASAVVLWANRFGKKLVVGKEKGADDSRYSA